MTLFRAGLHLNYIGGIERGERNVEIKAVYALAAGLRCGPSKREKLACTDGRGITSAEIAAGVLAAIKKRLLAPERVALAIEEARLAAENDARRITQARSRLDTELAEVARRAERLVDQVADGVLTGATFKDRLDAVEARRTQIESEWSQTPVEPVVILYPPVAEHYRTVVDSVERALVHSDSEAAA